MKILIIHLSDMHFSQSDNFSISQINAIIGTLQYHIQKINNILIIISGDLMFSGTHEQNMQIQEFLSLLNRGIKERYGIHDVQIAIVPGNHDVDYTKGSFDRDDLEDIAKNDLYEEFLPLELEKQEEFYVLAKTYGCFLRNNVVYKKILQYGNTKIQLNLINTAVFSSLCEDQGFHYIPERDIQSLAEQNDSDYVISIMHHPHHWYSWRVKKQLEEVLFAKSDLIFVGHEHYESAMKIESENSSVNIFSGGQLCNRGDWHDSEFHIAILNLETREYYSKRYQWAGVGHIYEEKDNRNIILNKKCFNELLNLPIKTEFISFLEEDKYSISKSVMDYFVFPLLIEEQHIDDKNTFQQELNSMPDFLEAVEKYHRIIISGANDSGKSLLAKAIFWELSHNKVVIFVNGTDVVNNYDRVIHNAFEDIYSNDKVKYETFKQMKQDDIVIIIDDIDLIDINHQEKFIEYVNCRFGTVIETCHSDIDVDIKNRLKKRQISKEFLSLKISPFFVDKRKELISKLVYQIMREEGNNREDIINVLTDALSKQKRLYNWNPEFIVQFTKYYCNNIGDAIQNDGSIFSKVFEANIVSLIKPYAKKITVDKIFMILDKIAYGTYISKNYPLSLTDITSLIKNYNDVYASRIDILEFIQILLNSKIMKKIDDKYIFYDRNYLAYFTAREIRRCCLENNDFTQFNHVMEYSYSGLNSDILLFVTYITDNLNIISMIIELAEKVIYEWKEFNVLNIDVPFLVKPIQLQQNLEPIREDDKKIEEKSRLEQEKAEEQSAEIVNDSSIFDEQNRELNFLQKIARGISLMGIIARILPSFEHMMKKEHKENCVNLIYKMPLKIFNAWVNEVSASTNELLHDIKEFHEWEYRKDKLKIKPLTDDQALLILRWEVISMLLELMNFAISNAIRENTAYFIDNFPYSEEPTYSIEHLMGIGKRDNVDKFIVEAENIYMQNVRNTIVKTMVQRVARNFMVTSQNIKPNKIQKLNSKLFHNNSNDERLVLDRQRNAKKK